MKLNKLLAIAIASCSLANAATITVSAGFGATQGLAVYNDTTLATTFTLSVGSYTAGSPASFASFGSAIQDTGKVNTPTGITATSPASFNSQIIHLFIGGGANVADSLSSGKYVVLRTNANTAFPADVSVAGSTTFNAALGSGLTAIATGSAANWVSTSSASDGGRIVFVPEPSVALLGALGIFGLVRRRR